MIEKIRAYIKKYHMIQEKDRLIVGVSGGVDSICLLFALLELKAEYHYSMVVVHVNHGLRGQTADEDETFVEAVCKKHQIECVTYHIDIGALARKNKQSSEEAGRYARREAFEKTLEKYGGTRIVMAHHKNDNAETLLMNLSRGTGLRGMCGMRPVYGNVIRPFLCVDRNEIEEYARMNQIVYRTDETNAGDDYTRNRIRNHVLPFLETQVNVQTVAHMNEAMEQMRKLDEYLARQVEKAYLQCVAQNQEKLTIDRILFMSLDDILKGPLIMRCISEAAGQEQDITKAHVGAVCGLFDRQAGKYLNLPYGVSAVRDYEGVTLQKQRIHPPKEEFEPVALQIPGITVIPEKNMTIECRILTNSEEFSVHRIPQKAYTKWFDYDIIRNNLVVRTRQGGDSIVIDKNGNSQKLKSYLINEKIPSEIRNQLPLIARNHQIVWIPGFRMSSAYQINEYTKNVLQIQIDGGKEDGRDD